MLNYTLLSPLASSGKMEVTPQQSEILQKELFKMGYAWLLYQDNELRFTKKPYLFWETDKAITYADKGEIDYFSQKKLALHLFDNHFKIEE